MARGFSVQSVEIEGFKGFTSPQRIEFKGRHIFLLGRNGNGKSSIVEAVRWGLFGSAFRPNEVIKNQHYSGDCRVTIELTRDGEPWTLRRILNLGANRTSDFLLTDQLGNRRQRREIMPQLDSVDAGEGAHIIFAAQSAPLQRQPEDLSAFERTVFDYLGLTHPRALLSNIDGFLEAQSDVENELGEELTEARRSIDGQIAGEQSRRSLILNAPPWGNGPTPSIVASEQKARGFIEDTTGEPPNDDFEGFSLEALLDSAEECFGERRVRGLGSLEKEATDLTGCRGHLESLRDVQIEVTAQKESIERTKLDLASVLYGVSFDELRVKLEAAKYKANTESIKARIMRDAIVLLDREESENMTCPICDSQCNSHVLASALANMSDHTDDETNSEVVDLESQLQRSEEFQSLLNRHNAHLSSLEEDAVKAMDFIKNEDKKKLAESLVVEQLIEKYLKKEDVLKEQIADQDKWFTSKRNELDRLKEESRFHQIQKRINDLRADQKELERVTEAYNSLVWFGQSVRKIKEVVESRLSDQLARDIPRVSEVLSNAFSALTQHPWYDRLIISKATLPKLELRVASSQDDAQREDPTGVLSGQAESALTLVPYFAFSQTDDTPTEVYLVMLDDPTRALDTEHIKILVERLRELGRNVQLIVASQETERFQQMIPDVFNEDSYVIIEPNGWSPKGGPNLKIQHG